MSLSILMKIVMMYELKMHDLKEVIKSGTESHDRFLYETGNHLKKLIIYHLHYAFSFTSESSYFKNTFTSKLNFNLNTHNFFFLLYRLCTYSVLSLFCLFTVDPDSSIHESTFYHLELARPEECFGTSLAEIRVIFLIIVLNSSIFENFPLNFQEHYCT